MNVLIVFYSRNGVTEKLALAAAVGAVQGRAAIRLRRLPPMPDDQAGDDQPEWHENRRRMELDYVAPKEADAVWANAIIVGAPARLRTSSSVLKQYADSLADIGAQAKMIPLDVSLDLDGARLFGRRVAESHGSPQ